MNRNIVFISLIVSGFFMLLSFILRVIFFNNYLSLLTQPLFIFVGWFVLIVGILLFLKSDFPQIYQLLIFFDKKSSEEETQTEGENLESENPLGGFEVRDDDELDYSTIYQNTNKAQREVPKTEKPMTPAAARPVLPPSDEQSSSQNDFERFLTNEDPKKIANVVKKYINE